MPEMMVRYFALNWNLSEAFVGRRHVHLIDPHFGGCLRMVSRMGL